MKSIENCCFVGKKALGKLKNYPIYFAIVILIVLFIKAFGLGSHIILTNLQTFEDIFYWADGKNSGDGVACLTGHKNFPIFAFGEACENPRIFIISYPDKVVVSIIESEFWFSYVSPYSYSYLAPLRLSEKLKVVL